MDNIADEILRNSLMMQRVLLNQLNIFRHLTEPQQTARLPTQQPLHSYRTPTPSSSSYRSRTRVNSTPYRPPRVVVYDDEEATMDATDLNNRRGDLQRSDSMEVQVGDRETDGMIFVGENPGDVLYNGGTSMTAAAAAAINSLGDTPRSPSPVDMEQFPSMSPMEFSSMSPSTSGRRQFPPDSPSVVSTEIAIAMDLRMASPPSSPPIAPAPVQARSQLMPVPFIEIVEPQPLPRAPAQQPPIAPAPVQARPQLMPVPFIEIVEPQPLPQAPAQQPPIVLERNNGRPICAICLEDLLSNRPTALTCYHVFCEACVDRHYVEYEDDDEVRCPICREDVYSRDDANPLYFP